MERKNNPKTFRHDSKEEIVDKAKKGVFDSNPLLAASHVLVCKTCGYKQKITYLSYLKSGRFELGEKRMVEVVHAAPTISGLRHIMERVTPIIIRIKCERCGAEMSCSPVSIEYLLFTVAKEQKLNQMYV
jgi:DNA-directed RNA polymerase subunit M/transcription elongation factor TFIIS